MKHSKYICIDRVKKNNKIIEYVLKDLTSNEIIRISPQDLKSKLNSSKKIDVENLTLAIDNRLFLNNKELNENNKESNISKKLSNKAFERDIYSSMLNWKNNTDYALVVSGARQVGKTYIVKKFSEENFKKVVYINIATIQLRLLKEAMNKYSRIINESPMKYWESVFKEIDPCYKNSEDTVIVIDEIQNDKEIYNSIRDIKRNLKSRLIVTGSYMQIVLSSNEYFISAGDTMTLKMNSMNYIEFLKAIDKYSLYKEVTRRWNDNSNESLKLHNELKEYYNVYLQIGGYPRVIKKYIESHNIKECLSICAKTIDEINDESNQYIVEKIDTSSWEDIFKRLFEDLINRKVYLDKDIVSENVEFKRLAKNLNIGEKDLNNLKEWLVACNLLGKVSVYKDFNNLTGKKGAKYYINDLGMLSYIAFISNYVNESYAMGTLAETFVYRYILQNLNGKLEDEHLFSDLSVHSIKYKDLDDKKKTKDYEIDFLMHIDNKLVAIEVKHKDGDTPSSDNAYKKGNVDFIIKYQDTIGGIAKDKITIPIYLIDETRKILELTKCKK